MKLHWYQFGSRLGAMALVGLTGLVAQAADEGKDEAKEKPRVEVEVDQDDVLIGVPAARIAVPTAGTRVFITHSRMSDYWLGLDCTPVSPAMRSQLKLDEEQGLVVENVMPESPAANAGFKQHDLLLAAGDKPLKDVGQLMTLLDESKDRELAFQLLRAGEKMSLTVKPEKRPQAEGPVRDHIRWLAGDGEKAIEVLRERLEKAGTPMRMQIFHPGMVVPGHVAAMAPFPKDLHVKITKQGDKPAEIIVEQGDKHWKVTDDKLADLPDNIRPHVEGLLGRMPMPKFNVEIEGTTVAAPAPFNVPLPPPGEISERLEKRLEEMNRRMEQMREQLQDLREGRRENRTERRDDREERRETTGEEDREES